jgi:hypothetical protein
MAEKIDYLEVDKPIPGQNYVCISFVSPETVYKQKELFIFNKYMNQRCGDYENKIDEIIKDSSDDLRHKIGKELKDKLAEEMKHDYDKFNSSFEDFKYKYNEELEKRFSKVCGGKTSIRGVKVRGVYDSYQQAESKAKELQRGDRSFHIFIGQMGYWLPWDPTADKVENEEYLEDGLNNMMKSYKQNEINRDIFYEEQKREKLKDAERQRIEAEKANKQIVEELDEEDPWMKSKFTDAQEPTEATDTNTTTDATEATDTTTDATEATEATDATDNIKTV